MCARVSCFHRYFHSISRPGVPFGNKKNASFLGGREYSSLPIFFKHLHFGMSFFYLNTEGCGAQRTQKNAFWLKLGVGEVDSHIF